MYVHVDVLLCVSNSKFLFCPAHQPPGFSTVMWSSVFTSVQQTTISLSAPPETGESDENRRSDNIHI